MRANGPGFSHLCLPISKLDNSIPFYEKFGQLRFVDRRPLAMGGEIARMTDEPETFVLCLAETREARRIRLEGFAHLAVTCGSKEQVDDLVKQAREEGVMARGPRQGHTGIGYSVLFVDPDGNQLELAYDDEVGNPEFKEMIGK